MNSALAALAAAAEAAAPPPSGAGTKRERGADGDENGRADGDGGANGSGDTAAHGTVRKRRGTDRDHDDHGHDHGHDHDDHGHDPTAAAATRPALATRRRAAPTTRRAAAAAGAAPPVPLPLTAPHDEHWADPALTLGPAAHPALAHKLDAAAAAAVARTTSAGLGAETLQRLSQLHPLHHHQQQHHPSQQQTQQQQQHVVLPAQLQPGRPAPPLPPLTQHQVLGMFSAAHMAHAAGIFHGSFSPEALLGPGAAAAQTPEPVYEVEVTPAVRDAVGLYLQDPQQEQSIIIWNARVAQKSYGSEKRFFCPPPALQLLGTNWQRGHATSGDPTLLISLEENWKEAQPFALDQQGKAVFRSLYISDSDKRKHFSLNVKVTTCDGREVGVFKSKPIKVISKPSKKKQTAKNIELSISSGMTIALFNRIRSQTVSTKYLCVEDGQFTAKTNAWDAFTITAYGCRPPPHGEEQYLHYGMEVVLQSVTTGIQSGVLIVRKAEKNSSLVATDEPISQLHKVAFSVKGSDHLYMALIGDAVLMERATSMSSASNEGISESAAWTIVGTDRIQYNFYEVPNASLKRITPAPVVDYLKVQSRSLLEIYGENFSQSLTVWFGHTPSRTRYRCQEFIVCEPPPLQLALARHPDAAMLANTPQFDVPLLLVRDDGVVFPTGRSYTFTFDALSRV